MADGGQSRVLVTGEAGLPVVRALLDHGPVTGIFAARRAGHNGPLILGSGEPVTVNEIVDAARSVTGAEPRYDLKAAIATVWPEFSETAK